MHPFSSHWLLLFSCRTEKTAKWQTIPCDLLVAVEELSYNCRSTPNRDSILADPQLSTPPFLLSPTLEPVLADGKPAGDRDSSLSVPLGPLVREAEEFMHEGQGAESFATPYLSYFNCLFLYPRCLNYSGQNSFPRVSSLKKWIINWKHYFEWLICSHVSNERQSYLRLKSVLSMTGSMCQRDAFSVSAIEQLD